MRAARRLACTAIAALSLAPGAHAQQDSTVRTIQAPDARWLPFLGCWRTITGLRGGPTVCIVPTADSTAVLQLAIRGDSIDALPLVSSPDAPVRWSRGACSGSTSGRWSADDRRLFTEQQYSCGGGKVRRARGTLSMVQENAFTAITGGDGDPVRVTQFVERTDTTGIPSAILAMLPRVAHVAIAAARVNAAADVSNADVVEASQRLPEGVVAAWLTERMQDFRADKEQLRAMRESGVPGHVLDVVKALAQPRKYVVTDNGATIRKVQVHTFAPAPARTPAGFGQRFREGVDPKTPAGNGALQMRSPADWVPPAFPAPPAPSTILSAPPTPTPGIGRVP